jgi:hypothetical protein
LAGVTLLCWLILNVVAFSCLPASHRPLFGYSEIPFAILPWALLVARGAIYLDHRVRAALAAALASSTWRRRLRRYGRIACAVTASAIVLTWHWLGWLAPLVFLTTIALAAEYFFGPRAARHGRHRRYRYRVRTARWP